MLDKKEPLSQTPFLTVFFKVLCGGHLVPPEEVKDLLKEVDERLVCTRTLLDKK